MTCPRCKGFLHSAHDEMRVNQGDVAELMAAECIKCANCGHRIYKPLETAVPFDKKMITTKPDYMKDVKPGRKPSHGELMQKYYSSIKSMRKGSTPTGWNSIAKLIAVAEGVKITGDTVAKYYNDFSAGKQS